MVIAHGAAAEATMMSKQGDTEGAITQGAAGGLHKARRSEKPS